MMKNVKRNKMYLSIIGIAIVAIISVMLLSFMKVKDQQVDVATSEIIPVTPNYESNQYTLTTMQDNEIAKLETLLQEHHIDGKAYMTLTPDMLIYNVYQKRVSPYHITVVSDTFLKDVVNMETLEEHMLYRPTGKADGTLVLGIVKSDSKADITADDLSDYTIQAKSILTDEQYQFRSALMQNISDAAGSDNQDLITYATFDDMLKSTFDKGIDSYTIKENDIVSYYIKLDDRNDMERAQTLLKDNDYAYAVSVANNPDMFDEWYTYMMTGVAAIIVLCIAGGYMILKTKKQKNR